MDESLYRILNKGWKSTCRILFKEELGELDEYADWLSGYQRPKTKKESCVSGMEVILEGNDYHDKGRFISSGEIREHSRPLTINEIKDIDSIAQAVSERWMYAGNKILGNCELVEASDLVTDSRNIYDSANIERCSEVFSGFSVRRGSKHVYGGGLMGASEFIVRTIAAFNAKRVFESQFIIDSSDVYLSHNCSGCSELMFCFFQRSKRYAIGNLELPKDRYYELKKKLLSEISEEIRREKRFPSLFALVPDTGPDCQIELDTQEERSDLAPIDRAFSSTYSVLFGRKPDGMEKYGDWLLRHTTKTREQETPFGRVTHVPLTSEYNVLSMAPANRTVTFYEGMEMGKRALDENEVSSLGEIKDSLGKIGCFSPEYVSGRNSNATKTPITYNAVGSYRAYDSTCSENVAYSSMSGNSRNMFGCSWIVDSEFCINCYTSRSLSRCFEADTSARCSDSYFVHNSEGLTDCMFCWNVKGMRNAIGNAQLPAQRYSELRGAIISQMADEIERSGGLERDIFKIGKGGRRLWNQKLMNH